MKSICEYMFHHIRDFPHFRQCDELSHIKNLTEAKVHDKKSGFLTLAKQIFCEQEAAD